MFKISEQITNNEIENPLWHGEMHALKKFYELNSEKRPNEKDCMFLSSHEPCSMCLSAITFAGFDNFYYLFPYSVTNNEFNIPHDLNILKEVFKITDGEYNKENSYWRSQSINMLIESLSHKKKEKILKQLDEIKKKYQALSNEYQENKKPRKEKGTLSQDRKARTRPLVRSRVSSKNMVKAKAVS